MDRAGERVTSMGAIAPRVRLNRNDPCYCGSGLKYKRCHLEKDRAQEHAEYQATLEASGSGHAHPSHALCRMYRPVATGMPADLRPDFNSMIRMMHGQGYTLLHVFEPRHLAREVRDYERVLDVLRRYGITVQFAADPHEVELKLAQRWFDCAFGEGVHRILAVGSDFNHYPERHRRVVNGVIELTVGHDQVALRLVEEKLVDWDAQGIPTQPLALRVAAATGDLLSDLLGDCLAPQAASEGVVGWETAEALLVSIVEVAGSLGRLRDRGRLNEVVPAIAIGLAFPQLLATTSNACIESLQLSEAASNTLLSAADALRSNEEARSVALAGAEGEWRTPAGFAAWVDAIDPAVLSGLGIEKAAVVESPTPTPADGGVREALAESPINPLTVVQAPEATPDLFAGVDIVAQSAQQPIDRLREEIGGRYLAMERLKGELEAARQMVDDKERQLQQEKAEIDRQEDEVDTLLVAGRIGQVRALVDILVEASARVDQLRDRWRKEGIPEALASQETPEVAKARELVAAYEGSQRRGAVDQLDPVLRQVMHGQIDAARKVLQAAGLTDLVPDQVELILPMGIALTAPSGRVGLTAILPFDAIAADALGPTDPATSVAAMVTAQMAALLNEFGSREQDPKVTVRLLGRGVTLLSMEVAGSIAEDDLADDQALCEQWLVDAVNESQPLRRSRLAIQFRGIEPGLLELLGELKA